MVVTFVMEGEPVGKGRPKFSVINGKAHVRTPERTVCYQQDIQWEYSRQCKEKRFPDGVPLAVDIIAYYRIPSSQSEKVKRKMQEGTIRPTKKPDCDNVIKAVLDALNGLAYKDDCQVCEIALHKWYSKNPRVEVEIRESEKTEAQSE